MGRAWARATSRQIRSQIRLTARSVRGLDLPPVIPAADISWAMSAHLGGSVSKASAMGRYRLNSQRYASDCRPARRFFPLLMMPRRTLSAMAQASVDSLRTRPHFFPAACFCCLPASGLGRTCLIPMPGLCRADLGPTRGGRNAGIHHCTGSAGRPLRGRAIRGCFSIADPGREAMEAFASSRATLSLNQESGHGA